MLPGGTCGGWASRQRHRAEMSGGGAWRAAGAGLGWGSVAGSGGAGPDDHGQPRIAVTDGSRESQPSGQELLPDLPPRDVVLRDLTIAPQLAVGEDSLGFWPALREVFPATPTSTRPGPAAGQRAQQAAFPPCSDPVGAFGPLSAPHDNRSTKPRGDEEELLARWADERRGGGTFPGPLGRAGGMAGPVGRPVGRAVCGGDPGGRFFAGVDRVHPRFLAPPSGCRRCWGRGPGVVAALDPRLPSGTPIGVGRAEIGRSVRETLAVGVETFPGPLGRAGGMAGPLGRTPNGRLTRRFALV